MEDLKQLNKVLREHKGKPEETIPLLQEVQAIYGYLPPEAIRKVAKLLRLSESTIYGVATFYAQFKFEPSGKHTIRVCRGTACHVKGGVRILREVEKQLGVKDGETTPDLEYTLETVACIGACAIAPNMTFDKDTYGHLTTKQVADMFSKKEGEK